jgi:hypothetical protein
MPATPRPGRLAPLALLCAALLCGCVSTTPGEVRTTVPTTVVAPATPAQAPSPDGGPPIVERYGVANAAPTERPNAAPPQRHHRKRAHHFRPRAHRTHRMPQQPPRPRHAPQRHPRPSTAPSSICDLGTRLGRWAPGSGEERICRRVYG